jgi:hypothetical protein
MGDSCPESLTPVLASLVTGETIDTDRGTWRRRLGIVEPLIVASLCEIKRRQAHARISLGAFRPAAVEELVVTDVAPAKLAAHPEAGSAPVSFPISLPLLRRCGHWTRAVLHRLGDRCAVPEADA